MSGDVEKDNGGKVKQKNGKKKMMTPTTLVKNTKSNDNESNTNKNDMKPTISLLLSEEPVFRRYHQHRPYLPNRTAEIDMMTSSAIAVGW